jgi:pimeloyl-ACP methyl ester carboxylesterase
VSNFETRVVERDDHKITALVWGDSGPVVVLLAGAGLPAGVYEPIAQQVGPACRLVAVDLRGHGDSARPGSDADFGFFDQADDVVAVLDDLGAEQALGFGHSLGGGVLLAAAVAHPTRFSRVVVFEPAVGSMVDRAANRARADKMIRRTRARRSVWPDRATLVATIGTRAPFDELSTACLDAYARWGTRVVTDGQVELACTPATEALMFEVTVSETNGLRLLRELHTLAHRSTEVVVLVGRDSPFPAPVFEETCRELAVEPVFVAGGHFAPFADEAGSAEMLRTFLLGATAER